MGQYRIELVLDTEGDDTSSKVKEAVATLFDWQSEQSGNGIHMGGVNFLGLEEIEVIREDEEEPDGEDEDDTDDDSDGDEEEVEDGGE